MIQHTQGFISYMSEVESGKTRKGNEWSRMTILIDMPGFQGAIYKLKLSVSGKHVAEVLDFSEGDKVDVGWTIYASEYNGNWYNRVDLVSIKSADAPQQEQGDSQPLPPAHEVDLSADNGSEDLPF